MTKINKIHLDSRVATLMDMVQGSPPHKGYSVVDANKLIQFISSDSTKRMVEKADNLSLIRICSDGENLSIYGDGTGWFLIGKDAKDELQRISVLNHQEDHV